MSAIFRRNADWKYRLQKGCFFVFYLIRINSYVAKVNDNRFFLLLLLLLIGIHMRKCCQIFFVFFCFVFIFLDFSKSHESQNKKTLQLVLYFSYSITIYNVPIKIKRKCVRKKMDLFYVCGIYIYILFGWLESEQPISVHIWHCVMNRE